MSFRWNPLYSLSGLAAWCILAIALVARPNRSAQGWLILVPLVAVLIAWMGFKALIHMGSSNQSEMDPMFSSLVIGLAVTGLMAPSLGRFLWPLRIMGFLAIMAVVFVAAISMDGSGRTWIPQVVIYSFCIACLLLVTLLMRSRVKARFSMARCLLWLGLGLVAISTLALPIVVSTILLSQHQMITMRMVQQMLMVGLILGAVLFGLVLPFILLMTLNGPWRKRFDALLGLQPRGDAPLQPGPAS